jgi:hypothetical protein
MIIFIHIPRTGGVAFTDTLRQVYKVWNIGEGMICHLEDMGKRGELDKVECVAGHIPFGVHRYFPQHCRYITMLRRPVERLSSVYYFFRNHQGWKGYNYFFKKMAEGMTLREFTVQRYAELDNVQVRHIAGMQITRPINTPVTEEDYIRARNNLDKFAAVGVLERLPESLRCFADVLGWDVDPEMGVSNSSGQPIVPIPDEDHIKAWNRWDQRLYEAACGRLDRCG